MGLLQDLKVEIETAIAVIDPQIEGLKDFGRLNLEPETKTAVDSALADFQRRRDLLQKALDALNSLAGDGYPDVPERSVITDVYEDLKANVQTIEAAFAKFEELGQAVNVIITPGTPRPKSLI